MVEDKVIKFTFADGKTTVDINGVKGPSCTNILSVIAEKLKFTCDRVAPTAEMTATPTPCPESIKG